MIFNIFILLSIIFIIHELVVFIDPYPYDKQILKIRKNLGDGYLNPIDKPFILFNLFYLTWSILGIFTTLWPYFAILIGISYISGRRISGCDETIKRLRLRRIDSLLALTLIMLLLLSHFLK